MSTVLSLSAPTGIDTIRGLSDALGSAEDVGAAASAAGMCLSAILGSGTLVTLSQPDASRRLQVVWRDAEIETAVDVEHPAKRQAAFETMRSCVHPDDRDDRLIAILPLSCRGEAVGVLEVLADARRIEDAWDTLEVVARQLGLALLGIEQQDRLLRQTGELQRALAAVEALTPSVDADGTTDDPELTIAWTAHELRGPLSALTAALGFLREQERSAMHRGLLDRCAVELDHMSKLVDDTLRWGSRGATPPRTTCNVVDVVRGSIEQCRLEFGVDRVSLEAPSRAVACVDPVQLRCAIGNLIRNALTYSPAHTLVEVVVTIRSSVLAITVRNVGPVVSESDGDAIFLPFVRGANADGRFGMGLGLFIARRVAEANGGRLTLHRQGEATEFRLEIPGGPR
jgi:signal transduction histidine kinase